MSKTAKSFIIIGTIWAILLFLAATFAGTNENIPHRFSGTYASDTVTFTFSGSDKVTAVCGDVTATGTYMNGTTGTKLVVWIRYRRRYLPPMVPSFGGVCEARSDDLRPHP